MEVENQIFQRNTHRILIDTPNIIIILTIMWIYNMPYPLQNACGAVNETEIKNMIRKPKQTYWRRLTVSNAMRIHIIIGYLNERRTCWRPTSFM